MKRIVCTSAKEKMEESREARQARFVAAVGWQGRSLLEGSGIARALRVVQPTWGSSNSS